VILSLHYHLFYVCGWGLILGFFFVTTNCYFHWEPLSIHTKYPPLPVNFLAKMPSKKQAIIHNGVDSCAKPVSIANDIAAKCQLDVETLRPLSRRRQPTTLIQLHSLKASSSRWLLKWKRRWKSDRRRRISSESRRFLIARMPGGPVSRPPLTEKIFSSTRSVRTSKQTTPCPDRDA